MNVFVIELAVWLCIMSIITFVFMATDKVRAQRGMWRVPEKTLFLCALLGGGVGGWIGMKLCRHKTRHWYFRIGFPLIAIIQLAGLAYLALNY